MKPNKRTEIQKLLLWHFRMNDNVTKNCARLECQTRRKEDKIIATRKQNKKERMPMYIVRSIDLVNWLCQRGYRLLKAEDSKDNPVYKVFMFEDSDPLQRSVAEWMSYRKRV